MAWILILAFTTLPSCGVGDLPTPWDPAPSGASSGSTTAFNALWAGKHPLAEQWTLFAESAISKYGDSLLDGPADVNDFCPGYFKASTQEKVDFFVQFLAAMSKYESSFDPTLRYTETSMGTDPVTGLQVVSEGLFQLSYQDENTYRGQVPGGTCDFDLSGDRRYPIDDLRRSILDPSKNITCAVVILNRQIERVNRLAVSTGAYWAVIKTSNTGNKLPEIKAITRALPFCK
jgi:hypothetical protein